MKRPVLAKVLALLLAATTVLSAQSTNRNIHAFQLHGERLLLIPATVDGHTGEFIVDTGSERTLVDEKFLGLKKSGGNKIFSGFIEVASANVQDFCISSRCFGKTEIGLMDFDKISTEIGSPICGMIGQDLLAKFSTITIDYKNRNIMFAEE